MEAQLQGRWIGKEVDNTQVAATIKQYGAPVHSAPNGAGKTILYYDNPDFQESSALEPVEDFADRPTRAQSRDRVEHTVANGAEFGTGVSGRAFSGGTGPKTGLGAAGNFGINPKDLLRDVEVGAEVKEGKEAEDPTIVKVNLLDKEELENDEENPAIDARFGGGEGGDVSSPVEIPELDAANEETPPNPQTGEVSKAASNEPAVGSPEERKSDGRSFAELSGKGKEELARMAKEAEVEVKRTDGREDLEPRIEDYIAALRTDR